MVPFTLVAALSAAFAAVEASPVNSSPLFRTFKPLEGSGSNDTGVIARTHLVDFSAFRLDANVTAGSHQGTLPSIHERNILGGSDNRYVYSNPNLFPYRAVGKVFIPGGTCSGALVGPSLVLTARHCAVNAGNYQFCPSFNNGQPNPTFGCANAIDKYIPTSGTGPDCTGAKDYAILRLDKRYGDGLGYFGYSKPDSSRFGQPILSTMGYPGDRDHADNSYLQGGVRATGGLGCTSYGPLDTDADSAGGQSGSPVWVSPGVIWGTLNSGGPASTRFAGDQNLEQAITFLRNAGG